MGFADYLSRNPSQPPPPPSLDDTQSIINTINDFKYILLNDTIEQMNADNYQTQNDVTKYKAHSTQQTNAFCLSRYANQSLTIAPFTRNSNPINSNSKSNPTHTSSLKSIHSNNSNSKKPVNSFFKFQNNLKSQSNPPSSESQFPKSTCYHPSEAPNRYIFTTNY